MSLLSAVGYSNIHTYCLTRMYWLQKLVMDLAYFRKKSSLLISTSNTKHMQDTIIKYLKGLPEGATRYQRKIYKQLYIKPSSGAKP